MRYEIRFGALLLDDHISSLILYTDYTKLCAAFTASFRRVRPFESLKRVKQRNACYYWMSRRLREIVECFGRSAMVQGDEPEEDLRGPFYTAMRPTLQIPAFAMRLGCPTSTSRQIGVALKFSGPKDVVLTLDNPISFWPYLKVRGWDCS